MGKGAIERPSLLPWSGFSWTLSHQQNQRRNQKCKKCCNDTTEQWIGWRNPFNDVYSQWIMCNLNSTYFDQWIHVPDALVPNTAFPILRTCATRVDPMSVFMLVLRTNPMLKDTTPFLMPAVWRIMKRRKCSSWSVTLFSSPDHIPRRFVLLDPPPSYC